MLIADISDNRSDYLTLNNLRNKFYTIKTFVYIISVFLYFDSRYILCILYMFLYLFLFHEISKLYIIIIYFCNKVYVLNCSTSFVYVYFKSFPKIEGVNITACVKKVFHYVSIFTVIKIIFAIHQYCVFLILLRP